jgi:hypothetical protein
VPRRSSSISRRAPSTTRCVTPSSLATWHRVTLVEATAPLARAALRELLSDEIDHARIGWALLGSLEPALLHEVEPWLPAMAVANLRMWRETNRTYGRDAELAMHGAPRVESVENALIVAFRDLILPGFEHLGMATEALRIWLEAGAPTR